jgi:hypothetical protein
VHVEVRYWISSVKDVHWEDVFGLQHRSVCQECSSTLLRGIHTDWRFFTFSLSCGQIYNISFQEKAVKVDSFLKKPSLFVVRGGGMRIE